MPSVADNSLIHLESESDLDTQFGIIMKLLQDGFKVQFVDKDHNCINLTDFNTLRGYHPSIKIITINNEVRPAVVLMVKDFKYYDNDNYDEDDDNANDENSEARVEETEPGDPTCPISGGF